MDWAKTTARRDEKHLSVGIWCLILEVWRFDGIWSAGESTDLHIGTIYGDNFMIYSVAMERLIELKLQNAYEPK